MASPPRAAPVPRQSRPAEARLPRPQPRPAPESETAFAATPTLLGLSEADTAALLGPPAQEASQPPAKIWIYHADGCELSVHLFPDLESGGFTALDYSATRTPRETCLGKVAAQRRTG